MEPSFEKEPEPKKSHRYCDKCDFTCNKMSNWLRHVSTVKHIQKLTVNKKAPKICLCGKQYTDRSGLWKHAKKCVYTLDSEESVELSESKQLEEQVGPQELIQVLIAENKDLKLLVLKLVQKLCL